MSLIADWIYDIEGLDVSAGIETCESEEAYLDALFIFLEDCKEKADELNKYYDEADWKNYSVKVHALKSTCRIIGAKELGDAALYLELASKEGRIDDVRANHDKLLSDFKNLSVALMPLDDKNDKEGVPLSGDEVRDFISRVRVLADDMDYDGIEDTLKEVFSHKLDEAIDDKFTDIKKALNELDFDRIIEIAG